MNEQENKAPEKEWFEAWLPKPAVTQTAPPPAAAPRQSTAIEQVRQDLRAVAGHLIDPSSKGVRACLPYLERAVTTFSAFVKVNSLTTLEPSLDSLRQELALASMLFENAYALQAGWAAQLGLNLDGTPAQILYNRPGETQAFPATTAHNEAWEG